MKTMAERITIITLKKAGKSARQIAKDLKISRTTVNKIIKDYKKRGENSLNPVIEKVSVVENYKDTILSYLDKEPKLSSLRIWEKLRDEKEFKYKYDAVRKYMKKLRVANQIYPVFDHNIPADEAYVDFGYVGLLHNPYEGKMKKSYVFCMRLAYSRYDYFEIVTDQKVKTFINCHENAFLHFGGVPKKVTIDNLKAGVLEANFYDPTYQKEYLEFSKHYNFLPNTCRPYKPKDKAMVENGIKYFKNNFMAGRTFKDINDCKEKSRKWMEEKSLRIHGTTKKVPGEVFENEEKNKLHKLPFEIFDTSEWTKHKLHPDCYLRIDKSLYSAPYSYVGEKLYAQKSNNYIKVYNRNLELIHTHKRANSTGEKVKHASHFPEWIELISSNSYEYYMSTAKKYGDIVYNYCQQLFSEKDCEAYRMIQGIISLGKKHGRVKLENACFRATQYENYSYKCIKNILSQKYIRENELFDMENMDSKKESAYYKSDLSKYDELH
ncbi:MAG: IS21 family transposase [Pseudomonadota bacterium]